MIRFRFDLKHNIAYISFKEKSENVNSIKVSEDIVINISADGTLYGIELLNAKQQLLQDDWKSLLIVNENSGAEKRIELP